MQYFAVFVGAGLGACLRFALSPLNTQLRQTYSWLPLGTLVANVLGGLLAGMVLALGQKYWLNDTLKLATTTGFLGGLTTFSTFGIEVFTLLAEGKYTLGIVLILTHLVLTLTAIAFGFWCVRVLLAI